MRSFTVPKALSMTTGGSLRSARSRASTSMPPMPGSNRSRTMPEKRWRSTAASASSPEATRSGR
jgi:hypothetical protein